MALPLSLTPAVRAALAAAFVAAVLSPPPVRAQEPEFYETPRAEKQWTFGRRVDESKLRYCVDKRDPDWEVAGAIADAISLALLLEPERYVVEKSLAQEDITVVYQIMLEHCYVHMGFKLIPDGYADWVTLTRPYYRSEYVFVTAKPDIRALGDVSPGRPVGATMGTSAHMRLVAYSMALPADRRWPVFPMGTNQLAMDSLMNGTVDVALVWAPYLWGAQRTDPDLAGLRTIDPAPLPATSLGVGALLLSNQTFLRTTLDEAIAALTEDGTIESILRDYSFPATPYR